jgi:signal transduction histidine kinase
MGAATMVTTKITAQSLEARTESQLINDETIVKLAFANLEENITRYGHLIASTEILTEELAQPSISRSLMIYLLSDIRRHHMKVQLLKREPPASSTNSTLIQKGFLGIRTLSLTDASSGSGPEARIESVAPIEAKKGVDQVVVVSFPLNSNFLKELRGGIGSDITLVLSNEQTVSTLPKQVLSPLLQELRRQKFLDMKMEKPYIFGTTSSKGPTKIMISPFLVNLKREGLLLLTMPMGDIVIAKRNIFLKGFLVTIIILSAASILYFYLINRVTKPLVELSAATQDIARGNLETQVWATTQDEIGELASSFNVMVHQLKESRDQIEDWGRKLEQRVEERTRELEQAHDELQETNTRLTQAMEELQLAQNQIIQSEKLASLGRLVAGVAHEVLNPLNAIDLTCQNRLRRQGINQEEKQDLLGILEELRRVVKITENLKSFARQSPPELRAVNLNTIIWDILQFIGSGELLEDDIQVYTDLASGLPSLVADPDQIRQALFNIISNAKDAMPGGGSIHVRTAAADGMVEVSVRDTGCGIPQEDLTRIFDPFFTTKPEDRGTGLGLSISQGIVEAHQGSIRVESEEGRGTTFVVKLPLGKSEESVA